MLSFVWAKLSVIAYRGVGASHKIYIQNNMTILNVDMVCQSQCIEAFTNRFQMKGKNIFIYLTVQMYISILYKPNS